MEEIIVIKKDGTEEKFNKAKIEEAILAAAKQVVEINEKDRKAAADIAHYIEFHLAFDRKIKTSDLHEIVQHELMKKWPIVYEAYAVYRNYKKNLAKSYKEIHSEAEGVLYAGDNENANKDSRLNSTKQALIGGLTMKEFVKQYELSPKWVEAHEEGFIHIHDMAERYLREQNCCLFNMGNLLDGGFSLNGAEYIEPKSIQAALAVVGDVTLSASAQQYGGFTIPEIDTVLAKYAELSYKTNLKFCEENVQDILFDTSDVMDELMREMAYKMTIREIEQGIQGFETKLNTVSNSLGQIPFVTVTFGLDTSVWGREIAKNLIKVREKGMGQKKTTAVFPKLVFLHRAEVNGNPGSPNFDIKQEAIQCSRTRLYPDYLSLDSGHLAEVYDRTGGKVVSPMGCRAYLSPFEHNGEEIYTGRSNIGAVSLNLPKIALEANGDWHKFFDLIEKYSEMVFEIHEDYYKKISKMKGSTNPLYFCEGGAWTSVGYDETVGKIYEASTASLGYIGVNEMLNAMNTEEKDRQKRAIQIVRYLKKLTENATMKYNHLYALYSTPAESLCYRFQKINQKQYGIIEGVTDREYMTNSFHVPVWEDVTAFEKLAFESPFHQIATGGKISYNEFVYGVDQSVLMQAIDAAMQLGLYYGVNVVSTTCENCGHSGDFRESCPKCESTNLTEVTRCCGYLSFGQVKGESRYNPGKQKEIKDRVKHSVR